jgi:phospholipid/cholesterol/gamma-HCH transport system ATP-binding protein
MNNETSQSEKSKGQVERDNTGIVARVQNLKKSFGDMQVLKGISLNLHQGENLAILGRSGSGKSVLIKCMVGLTAADEGEIEVLGYNVRSLSPEKLNEMRQQVGFSFQSSALYDSMTVQENLEFPLKRNLQLFNKKELNDLVLTALHDVGLEETSRKKPAELSGGMKKRIGIARTLILKPKIMLYDEPTAGLDPITSMEINDLILKVREKYNTSSIIITHDISCAQQTADRVIALINGHSKIEATFDELKNTKDPELAPFFKY